MHFKCIYWSTEQMKHRWVICVQLTGNSQLCHGAGQAKLISSNNSLMIKEHSSAPYPFLGFLLKKKKNNQKFCITNWTDVTESLSCVQEGVLNDMQGITTAACRRSFNMHRSVPVGNYHKAAKLLQAPTISVCCLPQESQTELKHEFGRWAWWQCA